MRRAQVWTISMMIALGFSAIAHSAAAQTTQSPPKDPEARKQWIEQQRQEAIKRREEFMKLPPEEQERIKAEHRKVRDERRAKEGPDKDKRVKSFELHGPIPLPVEVTNWSGSSSAPAAAAAVGGSAGSTRAGGKPAGGACAPNDKCQLRMNPPNGEVLIVTAVWSAAKVVCDDVSTATPPSGAPIAPGWRCEQTFSAEGQGAGYAGYLVSK